MQKMFFIKINNSVFLMIWKRERDRRVHRQPHKNDRK
jgi:hypothetical protein